jgi:hypothetical protein
MSMVQDGAAKFSFSRGRFGLACISENPDLPREGLRCQHGRILFPSAGVSALTSEGVESADDEDCRRWETTGVTFMNLEISLLKRRAFLSCGGPCRDFRRPVICVIWVSADCSNRVRSFAAMAQIRWRYPRILLRGMAYSSRKRQRPMSIRHWPFPRHPCGNSIWVFA